MSFDNRVYRSQRFSQLCDICGLFLNKESLWRNCTRIFSLCVLHCNLLVFFMKPGYFEDVSASHCGAAECMNLRTAQVISYVRSARVTAVPVLLIFSSVPFYQLLANVRPSRSCHYPLPVVDNRFLQRCRLPPKTDEAPPAPHPTEPK